MDENGIHPGLADRGDQLAVQSGELQVSFLVVLADIGRILWGEFMFERFRRYEVQAAWSIGLACISLGPMAGAAWLAWRNYDHQLGRIVFGSEGYFLLTFAGGVFVSGILAVIGFALGWNSAGQARNDRSGASWAGFFLGGSVLSANIILLLALYMLRLKLE